MSRPSKHMPLDFGSAARSNRVETVSRGDSGRIERWLLRRLLASMGEPPLAIETWDGSRVESGREPVATMRILDRGAVYRLLRNPQLTFGDLYSEGRIEVQGDLVRFLETVYRHTSGIFSRTPAINALRGVITRRPSNTLRGSRENIHHHYDIGNEFYRLWLDERMQYTCAYYPRPGMSLAQAQFAKLEHVCRKLELAPGQRVVEAGCGWGGLALHMAQHHGVRVQAYNISHEQVVYARARAKDLGLDANVEFVEDDYRSISGQYEVFVSVGMLEHVGKANYRTLGRVIDRALAPGGRGLIHSIGRNRPALMNAWIDKRIFPGAHPPTLKETMDILEPYDFSVLDVENLRLHYARTLEHWLEHYEHSVERVAKMFDERFVRAWRLYLAGSIAAFTTGGLQLFQLVFARGDDNRLPWSRLHMYPPGEDT